MNLASMELTLQRYGFDTTDPLVPWLNAALHEFEAANDWPFLEEGPVTISVAAGASALVLPSDAVKVITVRDLDHLYKLKYYNRHKFTRMIQDQADQGQAEVYTLIGTTTVQIWRTPLLPTNFEVVYQALVPDLVNPNDVPGTVTAPFPVTCHYPIVMRAASIALQAENEEERAKTAQAEYERALMTCMGKFNERELDEPETVEDAQGYLTDMPVRGLGSW